MLQATKQDVGNIVFDFTSRSIPFTAYDITKKLRKEKKVEHTLVRDTVREMYSANQISILFLRTTITLSNGNTTYLYHPVSFNPIRYEE